MTVRLFDNEAELAGGASNFLVEKIRQQSHLLLCCATGNTPTATYKEMVRKLESKETNQLRIIKLDEWGGVSMQHSETCEQYLQTHIIKPLKISKERYFGFNGQPNNPSQEIIRMQQILEKQGPIDICVLGLGANGHIAFNEPAESLPRQLPYCKAIRKEYATFNG